jgi:hypothetical protein
VSLEVYNRSLRDRIPEFGNAVGKSSGSREFREMFEQIEDRGLDGRDTDAVARADRVVGPHLVP